MAQSPSLTQRALRGIILTGGIVLLWLCAGAASARASSGATVTQVTLPQRSYPFSLVSVPDGNLWFTAMTAHAIGRVTPQGKVTEFRDPGPSVTEPGGEIDHEGPGYPGHITRGADGNLWFTAEDPDYIGRVTPSGHITDFVLSSTENYDDVPINGITSGPEGDVWFTTDSAIGRVTQSGTVTFLPFARNEFLPQQITTGADGDLWFTAGPTPRPQVRRRALGGSLSRAVESTLHGGLIVRMTPNGVFTVHRISQLSMHPTSPTPGPGNDIWFLESADVARITPRGNVRRFRLPRSATGARPMPSAVVSSGGDLWFTATVAGRAGYLDRMTPAGTFTQFKLPRVDPNPFAVASGPGDDDLWFADPTANRIGRLRYAR
jgi:virginiamycin B lyase